MSLIFGTLLYGLFLLILTVGCYIACVAGLWNIFMKAGEPGWKAVIPWYSTYTLCKTFSKKEYFFGILASSILMCAFCVPFNFILRILFWITILALSYFRFCMYRDLSKAFGQPKEFAFGLFFAAPVFLILLSRNNLVCIEGR